MGCKSSRPPFLRFPTRAETLKPIWELSVSVDSSSKESCNAESRQASRNTDLEAGFQPKQMRDLHTAVAKIDVKAAKKRFSPMDSSHIPIYQQRSTARKLTPKSKRQNSTPVSGILRFKTSRPPQSPDTPAFEDFTPPDPFLGRTDSSSTPKSAYKALRANYKLIRKGSRPASLDFPTASSGAGSLMRLMHTTVEDVHVHKRVQVKYLTSSQSVANTPRSPMSPGFAGAGRTQGGDTQGGKRGNYSIKTPHVVKLEEASRDTGKNKSRAERVWAWKGKMGSLRDVTRKAIAV